MDVVAAERRILRSTRVLQGYISRMEAGRPPYGKLRFIDKELNTLSFIAAQQPEMEPRLVGVAIQWLRLFRDLKQLLH